MGGVALIPLVVTTLFVIIALTITYYEEQANSNLLKFPDYFQTKTPETARAILSGILAGIISLTVFSFSMMMVVVNQASSNYSPKVVDTLMNQRFNKVILGFYLGTIVFTIITLMHIDAKSFAGNVPQSSLLTNIILSIACILLFVSFINKISSSVRVTNIIENIANETKRCLKKEGEKTSTALIDTDRWLVFNSAEGGYLQVVRVKTMMDIVEKYDLQIKVLEIPGAYLTRHTPLFSLNTIPPDDAIKEVRKCFVTYSGESIEDNSFYGLRQLREIAVKSLSPGINDPGVACLCIDHLAELLAFFVDRHEQDVFFGKSGGPRIILTQRTFADILDEIIIPIYTYGSRDFTVVNNLLILFYQISSAVEADCGKIFHGYIEAILKEADHNFKDNKTRAYINKTLNKLTASGNFNLQILEPIA